MAMLRGWQTRLDNATDGDKYRWAKGTHSSHLPNGELPIAVVNPTGDKSRLWLTEGTLKPFITAHRHGIACLGASGGWFTSAKEQTAETIAEYGELVIVPDAGDVVNPQVIPILQNLTTDSVEYNISRVKGKIWQEFLR
jgi:hypothetical protein